jgi:DNA invertase Pin-like site-specific DNA recombinase
MSTSNGSLIDAVGYLRCSGDSQEEASIPDQQKYVGQYAVEKGYRIIRWYIEVISGDDTENRTEFLRMRADATDRGDFKAVLCWNQDRFGRFDMLDAGYWIYPFRRAGVKLVTVNDGPIDWEAFDGQVLYTIKQGGKHQFLRDHSQNVVRGQHEAIAKGSWVGRCPYAYRVVGEKKNKKLVLGDPGQVRVVQRIYREYVEEGRSLNSIAARLNAEGFVTPNGHIPGTIYKGCSQRWEFGTVKLILLNPAYVGDFAGDRHSVGKYSHHRDGKVVKGKDDRRHKPKHEWTIRRDNHEAIIDRPTWEKAQTLLARGKSGRNQYSPEDNPYFLTGLLRCGKCGCPLWGSNHHYAGDRRTRYYECGNRKHNGEGACIGTTVKEHEVLVSIADHLDSLLGKDRDWLEVAAFYGALKPGDLPEAFAEVKKLVAPPDRPKQDRKRLEKLRDKLIADLTKARGNLVLLDPENIPAAQERIRKMDEDRAAVEDELKKLRPVAEEEVNAVALSVLDALYSLASCCRLLAMPQHINAAGQRAIDNGDRTVTYGSLIQAAPQVLKRLASRISGITCHTERKEGKRVQKRTTWINREGVREYAVKEVVCGTRHVFTGGEIAFRGIVGDRIIL